MLDLRRTKFCPPHFSTVNLGKRYNLEHSIGEWIEHNLSGRYFMGNNVDLDSENKIQNVLTIGFEDAKELSFFMLACPHLKYT